MIITEKKKYPIYKYLLLYIILFEAGTPVQTVYQRESIICIFLVAFIMFLYKKRMSYKGAAVLAITGISMTLANLLNWDIHFSTAVMILMVIFSAVIFSGFYKRSEFEDIYVGVMSFLGAISIVFYAIGLLAPDFVKSLPVFHGVTGSYPIVMGIFFYPCNSNLYLSVLRRNNGMFREMGLFAMLLIWAFCIILQKKNENRYTYKKLFIFIATLITTFSTTGVLALAMLFPVIAGRRNIKGIWKRLDGLRYVIFTVVIVIFGIIIYQYRILLFGKLNPQNADYGSFAIRYEGLVEGLSLFIDHPWGAGPTTYSSAVTGGADSITYFLGCFGLVTTFAIFAGFFLYFKNLDYTKGNKLFVLGAAMLVLMTQGVYDYVIFYMFVVYGYAWREKVPQKEIGYGTKESCSHQLRLQGI